MRPIPMLDQLHVGEPRGRNTVPALPAPDHLLRGAPWHKPEEGAASEQPLAVVLRDVPGGELRLGRPGGHRVPLRQWRAHAADGVVVVPVPELPGDEAEPVVLHGRHGHQPVPDPVLAVRVEPQPVGVPWRDQQERGVACDVQPNRRHQQLMNLIGFRLSFLRLFFF